MKQKLIIYSQDQVLCVYIYTIPTLSVDVSPTNVRVSVFTFSFPRGSWFFGGPTQKEITVRQKILVQLTKLCYS